MARFLTKAVLTGLRSIGSSLIRVAPPARLRFNDLWKTKISKLTPRKPTMSTNITNEGLGGLLGPKTGEGEDPLHFVLDHDY